MLKIISILLLTSICHGAEYAKIEGGSVVNVIVADAGFINNLPGTWILTPGGVGKGYSYNSGIFMTVLPDRTFASPEKMMIGVAALSTLSGLTYQWKKSGSEIGGATSSTFTIDPSSQSDSGSYSCVVSSGATHVESNSATITVN